jgi:hypothetical protein
VTFSNSSEAAAVNVVTVGTRVTLQELAAQAVTAAQANVSAANQSLNTAIAQLNAFNSSAGVSDVNQAYTDLQQSIASLQAQLTSVGPSGATALENAISSSTTQLNSLAALLPRWQQLDGNVTQALNALGTATTSLTTAQGQVLSANAPSVMTGVQIDRQSRTGKVVLLAAPAAVVVLLVGTALFMGAERLSRRRVSRSAPTLGQEPLRSQQVAT